MEPGKHQSGGAEETGVYPGGNGLPAVPASSGSAAETGDAAAYNLSDSDQEFDYVLTGQAPRVLGRSDVEVGEYDPTVRTGVWHHENDELQEGSGLDLKRAAFDSSSLLSDIDTIVERELRVEIPNKPERSFTIVDRGIFADFKELHYVAHGSFGVVLKATDTLGREVAIKVLTSEREEETQRFYNESTITAQLGAAEPSDRIIKVYARGTMDIVDAESVHRPAPYASMEFIDKTLSEKVRALAHLKSNGSRAEYFRELENALRVHLKNACMGIEYAHTRGIIHRDIKPDNIAISTAELGERTRILDWGLGKKIDTATRQPGTGRIEVSDLMTLYTANGAIVGSPPYMAPEQVNVKKVEGHLTDVYALGATMYELLTGEFPHKGTPGREIILKKLNGGLTLKPIEEANSLIPRPLRLIVAKAMAADPERRYQSAAEMAADIERYYTGHQVKASEALPLRERVREASVLFLERHKRPLTVATLLVGSIVPTAVWGISSQREQARAEDRAAAVSTLFNDVHSLPVKDADYGIRQIDSMLLKVEGERHELVTEEVSRLKAERERLQDFVDFRTAERQKYDRFVSEGQNMVGSMVFLYRDLYSETDSTHQKIEEILALFGADKNPDWARELSRDVFTEEEVASLEKIVANLQIAAVLRVLPIQAGNLENRISLASAELRQHRAESAGPYLERAEATFGSESQSYSIAWLRSVTNALRDGKEFPKMPTNLEPKTEIDYFLAAWGSYNVRKDYQDTVRIVRTGLGEYRGSALLCMMEAQALMSLKLNDLGYDAAIRAGQSLSSDNKAVQMLKSITLCLHTIKLTDVNEFKNRVDALETLLNDGVSGSEVLDPAFRTELRFRRMNFILLVAEKVNTSFKADKELMGRVPAWVELARSDLAILKASGLQYLDLKLLGDVADGFAAVGDYAAADEVLAVFEVLKQKFPAANERIEKFHWCAFAKIAKRVGENGRLDLVDKYAAPRFEILERVLGRLNANQFLDFVTTAPGNEAEEQSFITPRKYAAMIRARATELGVKAEGLPVLPDASTAPFKSARFESAKGAVLLQEHPGGLRWREQIIISNGQREYYFFVKVGVEENVVFLHDRSRNFWLRVTPEETHIWNESQRQWAFLYGAKK